MSGASTPRGSASQPKQISSRLLNMKFMQRAAATEKTKPHATSPHTPTSEPPLKRRRTGDHGYTYGKDNPGTPSSAVSGTPSTTPFADRPSNFASAGTRRFGADALSAAPRGRNHFDGNVFETEWVLDVQLPNLNTDRTQEQGYEEEDENDTDDDIWGNSNPSGRQTYGSFKKKKATTTATANKETSTPISLSKSAKRNAANKQTPSTTPRSKTNISVSSEEGEASEDDDDDDDKNDNDNGEDNSSASDSDSDSDAASSSDESSSDPDTNSQHTKKPSKIDFTSEEYLRKLDAMDFAKAGQFGLSGKQRTGLGGGGGSGGGGFFGGGASHSNSNSTTNTPRNKSQGQGQGQGRNKLGGQDFFEQQRKTNQSRKNREQMRKQNRNQKRKTM